MELEEAKKMGLELMETSKAAYLTTIDHEGFPITRAIFNLKNKEQFPDFSSFFQKQSDEFLVFISTNTSSSKTAHIKKNPAICVYYCDADDFKGFMLGGLADIITDLEIKKEIWLDWWDKYYLKGVEDPDYSLIRLHPTQARLYYKLNQTNFELGQSK